MPTKLITMTNESTIKQIKESLLDALQADKNRIKGIRIFDFALLEDAIDIEFNAEMDNENQLERLEEIIYATLKDYRNTLYLHNIQYIVLDEKEAVTYETQSYGEASFSNIEIALLKQFSAFANISEDTLQAFLTSQTKPITCIQDLLNMNVDELAHWHYTLGVPDNIRDFIDAHFFADRYATFSLRDIVEKIEDLLDYDELENVLTYEYGVLKDIMERRFGSMKYDW